jgi:ribonuclease P protein component
METARPPLSGEERHPAVLETLPDGGAHASESGRGPDVPERAADVGRRRRFGRQRRLRSSQDFARVRRQGRSVSGTHLTLGYARQRPRMGGNGSQPATLSRVGFTVGKRVGGAVVRNRVRRRLREAMRHRLPRIAPEWDLVVAARPSAAAADNASLAKELDALLARAKVLVAGSEETGV